MIKPNSIQHDKAARAKAWAFFFAACFFARPIMLIAEPPKKIVVDEMTDQEKKTMVEELLKEGDRLMEKKDYNLANATYESVFLIDSNRVEASKRIDQLKKKMVKEGVSETQLVTRIYDEEIDVRVKGYLVQAKVFMKQNKLAQARFNLQKALLINPLHGETNKLYKQVNEQLKRAA